MIKNSAAEHGHMDQGNPESVPGYVLLPGDPNRVTLMANQWDEGAEVTVYARQHRGASGTYKGTEIGAWSTGMGGPSVEVSLSSIVEAGAHTLIRVGTCGTLRAEIHPGDIIINDSHVRLDGCSNLYVMPEYPAVASYEVVMALVQACENLGLPYHVGTGCTSGSFFTGQCRDFYKGYRPSHVDALYSDLRQANVLNFEMEGATIVTLSRIMGVRAGMCAVVIANRETGEWVQDPAFEERASLVGAEAVHVLAQWDEAKKAAGRQRFYPGLLK